MTIKIGLLLGFTLLFCAALWGQQTVQSWNGLKILASTEADVQRLLGKPFDEKLRLYDTSNERVTFWFSGERRGEKPDGQWDVPKGTITTMLIATKKEVDGLKLIAEFKEPFSRAVDAEMPNRSLYLNADGSIEIETQKGPEAETVIYVAFRPTSSQIATLLCK